MRNDESDDLWSHGASRGTRKYLALSNDAGKTGYRTLFTSNTKKMVDIVVSSNTLPLKVSADVSLGRLCILQTSPRFKCLLRSNNNLRAPPSRKSHNPQHDFCRIRCSAPGLLKHLQPQRQSSSRKWWIQRTGATRSVRVRFLLSGRV